MNHGSREIVLFRGDFEQHAHRCGLGGIFGQRLRAEPQGVVVLPAQVLGVAEQRLDGLGMGQGTGGGLELFERRLDLAGLEQHVGDSDLRLVVVRVEERHLAQTGESFFGVASVAFVGDEGIGVESRGLARLPRRGTELARNKAVLAVGDVLIAGQRQYDRVRNRTRRRDRPARSGTRAEEAEQGGKKGNRAEAGAHGKSTPHHPNEKRA